MQMATSLSDAFTDPIKAIIMRATDLILVDIVTDNASPPSRNCAWGDASSSRRPLRSVSSSDLSVCEVHSQLPIFIGVQTLGRIIESSIFRHT